MDERRQLPRWEVNKEVKVWMSQTQDCTQCILEDIHLKGMRVSFNERLPQQESVRMSFSLGNNGDPIKIEAKIPWSKEERGRHVYGLSFTKIDEGDKDRLSEYIITNCYDQFRSKWWA